MDSSSNQQDYTLRDLKLMDAYTFISAFVLFASFLIVITRFRLWQKNKFLKIIPDLADDPVSTLINQSIGYLAYQNQEELYLIWVVILLIAQKNIYTMSSCSLLENASSRWVRELSFLYNVIVIGVLINDYKEDNKFYHQLLALLSLVLAKFLIRIVSYAPAGRAYGTENINLVAEYMKSEHTLTRPTDTIDPTCMKGYKYLVMGEKIKPGGIKAPDYSPEVELTDDVVTVERVWSCKKGLLHPSVDTNGHIKDVCLSFALFKLLRRRDFGYPAAEAQQTKTRQLIFDGLLAVKVDKERVFRVIKMELGFLRDLKFTMCPVGFAFGFPVLNLTLLGGTIGVTHWLAIKVFSLRNNFIFLTVKNHNVDYPLTNLLLILLILMELFEWLTYVFCDWTKVVMICRNVKSNSSLDTNEGGSSDGNLHQVQPWLFGYKVLALFCKPRCSLTVKTTLGQYSLLKNCHKTCVPWYYVMSTFCPCHKIELRPPGVKMDKLVPLTTEVKKAIFDTLVESRGDLTNGGREALRRNGASDLEWTLNLSTVVHTILVWHIATSLCAIPLVNFEESIKSNHEVATYLSNYCAYLVTFRTDLLPVTNNLVKFMIWEIVKETSEFFGKERNLKAKREKLMSSGDGGETIIHLGSKLGRLIEKIPEAQRWKLMAAFWSEFILYVAPSGPAMAHMQRLRNGSEFITHLWALLYHAGIIDTTYEDYDP